MIRRSRRLALLVLAGGPAGALVLKFLGESFGLPIAVEMSWVGMAMLLLVSPVVEELAFRGGLQTLLQDVISRHVVFRLPIITLANALTSISFCFSHLWSQSGAMASLVFIPSLVLGYLWDRTDSLWPCIAAHCWFNACFFIAFVR